MPQELSLTEEFTISETFKYYAHLFNIKNDLISQRTDFLLELLDLPSKNRRIDQLSSGQKRRVSFAAAMFHQPPLLLLDEPTVGADPLLRHTIWEHLIKMCKSESVTIILTTHYIEEARTADSVAMMRLGNILVEKNPNDLMNEYICSNLEDVFLKLCEANEDSDEIRPAEM